MKTVYNNIGYFFMEAFKTIRFSPLSNLFSVIGTGLILFLFGIVLTGWSIGDQMLEAIGQEAEVSAYFTDKEENITELMEKVKSIEGVLDVQYIDETQAETMMEGMLGEEADILGLFDDNPFEGFLEIRINLDKMDQVIAEVRNRKEIEYVRDNREVLKKLKQITEGLKLIGVLIIAAVGVTTLIIVSHMIRQGIYNNRDQINTLRLLGAPNGFIGFPFLLAGTLLTLVGGALAMILVALMLHGGYAQLDGSIPFLPLPDEATLQTKLCFILFLVCFGLGVLGSLFGLSSIKKENNN